MKRNILIVAAIVIAAILIRFLFSAFGSLIQGIMMNKQYLPSVTVGEIQEADVIKKINAPGRILSKHRVDIVARIEGYLTKSYFKEGDLVNKGQVLFEIEPQQWLYNVQKAQGNVENTKAKLEYAEKQVKRYANLIKKEYVAKSTYDEITAQRDALKAQLATYNAELRDAQRNYSYTRVKAPVDGQVGMITVTVGNYVNTSSAPLTTLYSTNPIYVTFPIDSKEYLKLTEIDSVDTNRKVELFFPSGEKYELTGIQDFHDNSVDETTGTITMRATFENPKGKLINGEFVTITVYSNNPVTVPVVAQTAVLENPQGKFVYTLDKDNVAKITFIKTSGQEGNNWIVEEGIQKGDRIITSGIQKVIPDNPVKIINKDQDKEQKDSKKENNEATDK